MNIALWIVQFFLAAVFVGQGAIKFSPPANLPLILHWVVDLHHSSPGLSAFIGVSELLGAVGLILPGLTEWQPRLTPLAAFGLAIAMSLAAIYHLQRGEIANIGVNAILLVLTSFVVWGRARVTVARQPLQRQESLMKKFATCGVLALLLSTAAYGADQTLTGEISSSNCAATHTAGMSPQDCTRDCVDGGASYVFVSKGKVYKIANQGDKNLRVHAGETVALTGDIKGDTITVAKIEAVTPSNKDR